MIFSKLCPKIISYNNSPISHHEKKHKCKWPMQNTGLFTKACFSLIFPKLAKPPHLLMSKEPYITEVKYFLHHGGFRNAGKA